MQPMHKRDRIALTAVAVPLYSYKQHRSWMGVELVIGSIGLVALRRVES